MTTPTPPESRDGWEELRREIEAFLYDRHGHNVDTDEEIAAVLVIVDRLARQAEPGLDGWKIVHFCGGQRREITSGGPKGNHSWLLCVVCGESMDAPVVQPPKPIRLPPAATPAHLGAAPEDGDG